MKTNWTLNEHSEGTLEVVVDGDSWKKAQKKAFNNVKKNINVKGFRQGQVPDALIRRQVSKEYIYGQAVDSIANEALRQGIDEHNLEVVARPTLDYKDANDESVTLTFDIVVMPEVELGEYKGLDIHKVDATVTDEDVENEIKNVQNRYADWVLREDGEAAQDGDEVTIDFVGKVDGVAFDGGSAENYPLVLGSNSFIPGFEAQVVGMKTNDVKDVEVTFPEDYQAKDLAGKDAVFTVTAHDIKYKELPEVNDELIKMLKRDGVETLEKYKEVTREELQKRKENDAEDGFSAAIINAVKANAKVDIPQAMIDAEVEGMYNDFARQMQSSGYTLEQYLKATSQTADAMKAQMAPEAESRIKSSLVLNAVVKAENIEVTEEDIENEYKEMSDLYSMEVDQIRRLLPAENMKDDLAQKKALELIKASVK